MTDSAVIDSSTAIKWFVTEPYSTEARVVLDAYRTGALTLLAPDLIYAEVGNIVWKKQRFQGLDPADAVSILDAFQRLTLVVTPAFELLADAYALAVAHERTVYDSLYLALSIRKGCRMVTADEKLANALSGSFPQVVWVGNWT